MAIRPVKDSDGNAVDGWWEVDVYARRRPDGTRPRLKRRVHGGITAARRVERDLLTQRDAGRLAGPTSALADYLRDYLDGREGEVSALTLDGYRQIAERYVSRIGALRLSEVSAPAVRHLYRELAREGLSGTTRLGVHRVLAMALKQAAADGLIPSDPMRALRAPQADTEEVAVLSPDEVRKLLELLEGTPGYMPALLAVTTGLRRGELLALKREDVNLETGVLRVVATVQQVGKRVTRKTPKTKRSARTVGLSKSVVARLREHLATVDEAGAGMGRFWRDEGFLFPSMDARKGLPAGRLWTPSAFAQAWRRSMDEANGRLLGEFVLAREPIDTEDALADVVAEFEPWRVHFHQLRHTAATLWLSRGARDEVVSRVLGHSSSRVTKSVYSHLIGDEQAVTIEIMDDVLGE